MFLRPVELCAGAPDPGPSRDGGTPAYPARQAARLRQVRVLRNRYGNPAGISTR